MSGVRGLIFDASVLIDFVSHDRNLLGLVAGHVAPVVIPLPVLIEVDGLDEDGATALGLTIHESTRAQMDEAMDRPRTLSFEDYICFVTARDLGIACVTNDEALLDYCREQGIPTMRGFRPLLLLVGIRVLTPLNSLRVVRAIHERNAYITRAVVMAFASEVREIAHTLRAGGAADD